MTLVVRPARFEDTLFVYAVSQSAAVRAMSVRPERATFDAHLEWWDRRFYDRAQSWWIAEDRGRASGYVRYGRCGPGEICDGGPMREMKPEAEISIAVAEQARGTGIGGALLQATMTPAREALCVGRFVALVRPTNVASVRLFTKQGFRWLEEERRMGVDLLRFVLDVR